MNADENRIVKASVLARAATELDRLKPLLSTTVVTAFVGELSSCERSIRAELDYLRDALPAFPGKAIASPEEYQAVGGAVVQVKNFRKRVAELIDPVSKAMNALHKSSTAFAGEYDGPAKTLETQAKNAMVTWDNQERVRIEAEEWRRRGEARRAEEDRRQAQALELEAAGRTREAEALLKKPIVAPVVSIPPPPKPKGVSYTTTWVAVIEDRTLIPDKYWIVDEPTIQALARKLGQALDIPGVRVEPQTSTSVRT